MAKNRKTTSPLSNLSNTGRRQKGLTLLELLTSITLGSILMSVGVPSLNDILRTNRLADKSNELIATLHLTRSEAIKRGTRVTLCKSADGSHCDTSTNGYEQGWLVFEDSDNDAQIDAGESLIRVTSRQDALELQGTASIADYVSYVADGLQQTTSGDFQAGTLTLCYGGEGRDIVLMASGHIRTVESGAC